MSQVTDRGYSIKEVSERLGISAKSLYDWRRSYHTPDSQRQEKSIAQSEIRCLKAELVRVTEERDILKRQRRTLQEMPSKVRLYRGTPLTIFCSGDVSRT